jgi:two-component sensor histidine kinase
VFFNIIINAEYFMLESHQEGTLTVTAARAGHNVRVIFSDDGPGIPDGKDEAAAVSLGMELINLLVFNQLKGSMRQWNDGGARYHIEIPIKKSPSDNDAAPAAC